MSTKVNPLTSSDDFSHSTIEKNDFWCSRMRQLGAELSVSGLRYVSSREEPVLRRIIWALLVVGGLAVMVYQISASVIQFRQFDTDVSLTRRFVHELPLPTVTICSENIYSRSAARALGIEKLFEFTHSAWVGAEDFNWTSSLNLTTATSLLEHTMSAFNNDSQAFYNNMTLSHESYFLKAYLEGQELFSSNFSTVWTRMGRCFSLNVAGNMSVSRAGGAYGLHVFLDARQEEYIATTYWSAGFRVGIHHHDEHFPIESDGIRVSPGQVTTLRIEKTESTYLKDPYGTCTNGRKLKYHDRYSRNNCQFSCVIDYIFKICQCYALDAPIQNPSLRCNPIQEGRCVVLAYYMFAQSEESRSCVCDSACEEITYDVSLSSNPLSELTLSFYADVLHNGSVSVEQARRNILGFNMYFPSMSYMELRSQVAYPPTLLFNDLGGALGLMLGSTFLTVYEFFDFFIWAAWEKHKANRTYK